MDTVAQGTRTTEQVGGQGIPRASRDAVMNTLAVDVGRSAVNFFGSGMEAPEFFAARACRNYEANRTPAGELMTGGVDVGGEHFLTDLPPRAEHVSLHHDDFFRTKAYKALVYEAMDRAGSTKIGTLVLALPAFQQNAENSAFFQEEFVGTHSFRDKDFTIDAVLYLDQAVAAAASMIDSDVAKVDYGDLLIGDFGLRTFDAAVVTQDLTVNPAYSFTSMTSAHEVYEAASRRLPVPIHPEEIDARMRSGATKFSAGSNEIDLKEIVNQCARETAPKLIEEIRGKYRNFNGIGVFALAGGAAPSFEEPLVEGFRDVTTLVVVRVEDSDTATVRGMYAISEELTQNKAA